MRKSFALAAALTVSIVAVLAMSVQGAFAGAPLTCGDTVTSDTWLTGDLDCSAGGTHGLIIGASGITVDLHGYTISGAGELDRDGVHNSGGYDNVTIRNGSIDSFGEGVYMRNEPNSTDDVLLERLTITNSRSDGVELQNTQRAKVYRVVANNNGDEGIQLRNSRDAELKHCTANGNGFNAPGGDLGFGITINASNGGANADSSRSRILYCTANNNRDDGIMVETSTFANTTIDDVELTGNHASYNGRHGITLEDRIHGSKLSKNKTNRNGGDGIHIFNSDPSELVGNRAIGNDDNGISGNKIHGTSLRANSARDNGADGSGHGFFLFASNDLRLSFNTSSGNATNGYELDDMQDADVSRNVAKRNGERGFQLRGTGPSSNNNMFVLNKSLRNGLNGFETRNKTAGNTFRLNTANGSRGGDGFHDDGSNSGVGNTYIANRAAFNDDDGIDTNRNDATITRNLLTRNGGAGVEASSVASASRNLAFGNSDPCSPAGGCSIDF